MWCFRERRRAWGGGAVTRLAHGLLAGEEPVLRIPARINEINANGDIGDVFGGWTMSQIDIAGGIVAVLRSRGRAVTACVERLVFMTPVKVGDIVSLYAELLEVGRTSMKISVQAYAHRNPEEIEFVQVAAATLTYVAVDGDGSPRPVPPEDATEYLAHKNETQVSEANRPDDSVERQLLYGVTN
jgi:acyl-CoA thioesterase YciA